MSEDYPTPPPKPEPEAKHARVRRFTQMTPPPPTRWIGTGWLPRALTILVGDEGIGKSLAWVKLAAHITTGTPFKEFGIPERKPEDVLAIISEDSLGEVAARLQLAGADMNRMMFFSEEEDGSGAPVFGRDPSVGDFGRLTSYLDTLPETPGLVVVDAWLDTVDGGMNVRDTQHARQALNPWREISEHYDLATLLVTHTNRMDTTNTRDLMGGTVGLRQKARMVLFAARQHPEEPELFIGPDKANTTGLAGAIKFDVAPMQVRPATDDDPGTTAHLTTPTYMMKPMRELLIDWKHEELEANRKPTKAEQAEEDLRAYMEGKESAPSAAVKEHLQGLKRDDGETPRYGAKAIRDAMANVGESTNLGNNEWVYSIGQKGQKGQKCQPNQKWQPTDTSKTTDTSDTSDTSESLKVVEDSQANGRALRERTLGKEAS